VCEQLAQDCYLTSCRTMKVADAKRINAQGRQKFRTGGAGSAAGALEKCPPVSNKICLDRPNKGIRAPKVLLKMANTLTDIGFF